MIFPVYGHTYFSMGTHSDTQIHTDTQTDTTKHIDTQAETHEHMNTWTDTLRYTLRYIHRYMNTLTHTKTHRHTHPWKHTRHTQLGTRWLFCPHIPLFSLSSPLLPSHWLLHCGADKSETLPNLGLLCQTLSAWPSHSYSPVFTQREGSSGDPTEIYSPTLPIASLSSWAYIRFAPQCMPADLLDVFLTAFLSPPVELSSVRAETLPALFPLSTTCRSRPVV